MEIISDIDLNNPAVVFLQDAGGVLNGPLGDYFKKWNVRSFGQYIVASKLPLGELQVRDISYFKEQHTSVRTQIDLGGETVALYNVHFATPRFGLNALREVKGRPWYLPSAIQQLENNVMARQIQVRALREYIRQEKGPVIVAGDLNSPDDSLVCSTLRSVGLHDAFAEGGKGYGYTYGHSLLLKRILNVNVSWMRIDHIMMSKQFRARDCSAGSANASAHRPVIADLVLLKEQIVRPK
jgi:endonuclease/exonuclease/phosphatase family metal-dependent hydrolase